MKPIRTALRLACLAAFVAGAGLAQADAPAAQRAAKKEAPVPASDWRPTPRKKAAGTIAGARRDTQSLADKAPGLHTGYGWRQVEKKPRPQR